MQPFGHKYSRHWPKIGGCAPFWEGAGFPSNTKSPGPRPTSIRSGIFIHPAVWPQQTWSENCGLCPFGEGALGFHLTQCGQARSLPPCQVTFWSIQPFGDNIPTSQTGQDNGTMAYGELFYKQSPKNRFSYCYYYPVIPLWCYQLCFLWCLFLSSSVFQSCFCYTSIFVWILLRS